MRHTGRTGGEGNVSGPGLIPAGSANVRDATDLCGIAGHIAAVCSKGCVSNGLSATPCGSTPPLTKWGKNYAWHGVGGAGCQVDFSRHPCRPRGSVLTGCGIMAPVASRTLAIRLSIGVSKKARLRCTDRYRAFSLPLARRWDRLLPNGPPAKESKCERPGDAQQPAPATTVPGLIVT